MTTELFEASDFRCSGSAGILKPVDTCSADCRQLTTRDYMDLLWTTLAEFPGLFPNILTNFFLYLKSVLNSGEFASGIIICDIFLYTL